jgi:hypothetical protein
MEGRRSDLHEKPWCSSSWVLIIKVEHQKAANQTPHAEKMYAALLDAKPEDRSEGAA